MVVKVLKMIIAILICVFVVVSVIEGCQYFKDEPEIISPIEEKQKEKTICGYTQSDLDLICAIVAQECDKSYDGALAVITCAYNRTVSKEWRGLGHDVLSQLTADGQFCYDIDQKHEERLNGNYPYYVREAVLDCLNGKTNHEYLCFRSYQTEGSVNIGGNWYFESL